MERIAPRHIEQALASYDPQLSVVWDSATPGWRLAYAGEPQSFVLEHESDGTPIMDLYESELLEIVRRADRYRNTDFLAKVRAQAKSQWQERLMLQQRLQRPAREDFPAEFQAGRDAVRLLRYGPRPFVGPLTKTPSRKGS